ncbi:sugar ABC transporter ATP-binding protein [Nocardioides sp.]|uniref:sugar ABC transporter ATP-binding protein n=1 Tax=Nocardioides sp. TaxID=35761 RepID=UPI003D0C5AF5
MKAHIARLEITDLSKTFGETRVLSDVDLSVAPGEIHGLVGQNGSGKSTLIKILTGYHAPDRGADYRVDAVPLALPVRWRQAHAAGVSVVHQDLGLLDELSVAENICVGGFPTTRPLRRIDRRRTQEVAEEVLRRLSVALDPSMAVATLNATQRVEVAVARALRDQQSGRGLMILDESTRALGGVDLEKFHAMLRRLADDGGSILMISHNLPEVLQVCDRVTVLQDGRVAAGGVPTTSLDEPELARLMLGRSVATLSAPRRAAHSAGQDPAHITVAGLRSKALASIDFTVGAGEVVGITGLAGNGYEEIPYLLAGARNALSGELRTPTDRLDLRRANVGRCMRAGIVLVPERREREGLAFDQNVRDNICLPTITRHGRPWFVGRRWQDTKARAAIHSLDIKPQSPHLLVKKLSGGNQQKVMVAKWLTSTPALLLLHEPTQAVDVGARFDILTALRHATADGVSIVIVSSEPMDLVALCDRILLYDPESGLEHVEHDVDVIIEKTYGAHVPMAHEAISTPDSVK